jgi:riboflavin biosynthesis pyrimidine reductase
LGPRTFAAVTATLAEADASVAMVYLMHMCAENQNTRSSWSSAASGTLELGRAVFRTPEVRTVVIATPSGRDALVRAGASRFGAVAIHAIDTVGNSIDPLTMIQFLRSRFGVQILLHEGGPTLFGQFPAAETVDELFLTLSPQIAGRAASTNRPGIVQGVEFAPNRAPWYQLLSLRQRADHLYLRYQRKRGGITE